MMHSSKRKSPRYWRHRLMHSWIINTILLPLAIGVLCNYIAHWMK